MFSKFEFGYSLKNISLPSQKEYLLQLINSVETFVSNVRKRAYFFLNPLDRPQKEKFEFKSIKASPKLKDLRKFEDNLFDLVKKVQFRKYSNAFQRKLKEDRLRISNVRNVIVPADKSSNHYEVHIDDYKELLSKEVHKHYKKAEDADVNDINAEHSDIVTDLEIDDRVFRTVKSKARVTLKDHKDDFRNKPKTRLINSCKPNIGKVAKKFLSRIADELRAKTELSQWKNSYDVINWFKNINNKSKCSFIILDICEFYPSISEKILRDALNWASSLVNISDEEKRIIISAKRSILYMDNVAYKKKTISNFDVTMGSFDGAETSDLIGLYLLSKVQNLGVVIGCFRDDWLGYSRLTPRQTDIVKKKLIKIFEENGFRIEIKVNKQVADFLDVTFDMKNESYQPFTKENHNPVYVNKSSNHPPSILKNIPLSVNDRLSRLSSSKEIFDEAAKPYQRALNDSGYNHVLEFKDMSECLSSEPKRKRNRSRRITYFNPPFSLNVETNIGKEFLDIVRNFPRNSPLHQIINTNCIKLSYRTCKNMESELARHNNQVLQNEEDLHPPPRCNCQAALKPSCPMPGYCTASCVVYRAKVTEGDNPANQVVEYYTGLTENTIKKRIKRHYSDIEKFNPNDPENHKSGTRLSRHCGQLKNEGKPYSIDWSILCETKTAFCPTTGFCKLCTMEKYLIMFRPADATLNLRSEFFGHCRHKEKHLLINT